MTRGPDSPLVVIMGPTASGKSALALAAARRWRGEIISADSMQFYRGLNIGTAKPTAAEQAEIPHHLIDCLDFAERMDVYEFVRAAETAVRAIRRRGRLPIVAGGSGMYLKALLYGLDPLPGDEKLRRELDEAYDHDAGFDALKARMAELDSAALARWRQHRRKLIRALEVRLLTGRSILALQSGQRSTLRFAVSAWRLEWEPAVLKERIAARTREMLAAGWIPEAEAAIRNGLLESPTARQALGYRLIGDYLAGSLNYDELTARIVTATWQLARRQQTWFRHQHPEAAVLNLPAEEPLFWERRPPDS